MPYTILPNSGQSLGQTRQAIHDNFQLIQSTFDANHIDFDATGPGKHKFLQMPVQALDPTTLANEGGFYVKTLGGAAQLVFRGENNGSVYQITSAASGVDPKIASFGGIGDGWTFLPGNLIMNYGNLSINSTAVRSVTFARPFKAATFPVTIQFSAVKVGSASPGSTYVLFIDNSTITNTGFNLINQSGHSYGFYWSAIGISA